MRSRAHAPETFVPTTTTSSQSCSLAGSVRTAEPRDIDALVRLLRADWLATPPAPRAREHGHLLVLDVEGSLRGATYVAIDEHAARAHVVVLVVAAELGNAMQEVEVRLIGVSRALCEAYGCTRIEIAYGDDSLRVAC
jgi:hypothetical protein